MAGGFVEDVGEAGLAGEAVVGAAVDGRGEVEDQEAEEFEEGAVVHGEEYSSL